MDDGEKQGRAGARWFHLRPRRRGAVEAEVRAEIDEHVAMCVEYLVARGHSRDEAERMARKRFGDFDDAMHRLYDSARERDHQMNRRERLEDLRQDLRLAVRLFRRSPAFFSAAVLTLALGIGANGAVFSIVQATLLQPLPYATPNELAMIWRSPETPPPPAPGQKAPRFWRGYLTAATLRTWRDEPPPGFSDVAGILSWDGNLDAQADLTLRDRAERLRGAMVTPNFFELLGVRAARGRLFASADEHSGEPLVILSDAMWRTYFNADTGVVGQLVTLTLGEPREPRTFTVVGILPPAVRFTYPEHTEAWFLMPWSAVATHPPNAITFQAVGRIAPGFTLAQGADRLLAVRAGLERPGERPEHRQVLRAEPMREWIVGETRPSLYLLSGVAALLLLITCATVANGLLARVSERRRELALRASLGASRGRVVRQLLTEGALLSLCGVVAGTLLAAVLQPVLRAVVPPSVPHVGELTLNASILGFAAVATAVTTMLAALAPAFDGSRTGVGDRLLRVTSGASADRATVWWRQGLVAAQAAVATTLLVSAVLLLASFWRLGRVPLGFDGEQVVTAEMRLLDPRYRQPGALAEFQSRLIERVRAIPGVVAAGLTSAVPFRGVDFMPAPSRPGEEDGHWARGRFVDPGFFDVMRIPLRRGRLLTDADQAGSQRVMVVSESYARKVFGDGDPIGQMMDYRGPIQIVGVVADVRYESLDREAQEAIYLPRAQFPEYLICVVLRATLPAEQVIPALRRAIHELDPGLPAMNPTTIDRIIDESVAGRRFYTAATAAFAAVALLLAIAGIAVVVARVVAERYREMAIRSALGATLGRLVVQAVKGGLAAVVAGVALGLAGAWVGAVLLAQFLFLVEPRSAAAYALVAGLVISVAGIAAWLSARRLGRIPLSATLRAD